MAPKTTNAPTQPYPPLRLRLSTLASVTAIKCLVSGLKWKQSWKSSPSENIPDLVKTYECRPHLPIRLFFPKNYDQTSLNPLPTFFNIHGGGYIIGEPADDDPSNRRFADTHNILVIELNYSKAPWSPFPIGLHDLESLILAAYDDANLPVDRNRIAIGGYSAGGTLALSVVQLPVIREKVRPSAVVPIYPSVDESLSVEERCSRRYFKPSLPPRRNTTTDYVSRGIPLFRWSYIPYDHSLHDPLISPYYASREHLPRNIYIVAAELDQVAPEAWDLASKLAGRPVPSREDKAGQENRADETGTLILDDERFHFQSTDSTGGSVNWLLVPDVLHGFTHMEPDRLGLESVEDARSKAVAYQQLLGEWLHNVVWQEAGASPA